MTVSIEDIFKLLEQQDGKTISAHALASHMLRKFAEILSNAGDWNRHVGREPFQLAMEWHSIARPLYTDVAEFDLSTEVPDAGFDALATGVTLSELIKQRYDEQPSGMLAAKINIHATVLMLCSVNREGKAPDDPADLDGEDAKRVLQFLLESIYTLIPAVDLLGALADGE